MIKKITVFPILLLIILLPVGASSQTRNINAKWEYQSIPNLAGFKLYMGGAKVCENNTPTATEMNCEIDAPDGQTLFTLTAFFDDNSESSHSPPFTYTFTTALTASFSADTYQGDAPLQVEFSAAESTGSITAYNWSFGDGSTGQGNLINHTYSAAGSYTVNLQVTDDTDATDSQTSTITVNEPTAANNPPTAIISSSSSVGQAPLLVNFDGSSSNDSDGTIISFHWDMGDGSLELGANVNHTYNTGGTFNPRLTVTDNGGLTDNVSTPVIVEPPEEANKAPVAVITDAYLIEKKGKYTLVFNGTTSYDPDGTISGYLWTFGDGDQSTAKKGRHTFSQLAIYTLALKVTDNQGLNSTVVTRQINLVEPGDLVRREDEIQAVNILPTLNYMLLTNPAVKAGDKDKKNDK